MKILHALSLATLLVSGAASAQTAAQAAAPASADDPTATLTQSAVSLTLYQQGLAVVRDERTVELGLGANRLRLPELSRHIVPGSTLVSGLDVDAVHYVGASLSGESLLRRHVGKEVTLLRTDPMSGQTVRQSATLLAAEGPVVRIGERVEVGGPGAPWRIAFDEVPADLTGEPGLVLELDNQVRGPQSLELVYLTGGMAWQADYVGVLDREARRLRLSAWASISNDTDVAFRDARVQLLAGEISRAAAPGVMFAMEARAAKADMATEAAYDYHLYHLEQPVSLPPGQRTQLSLFGSRELPVVREYRVSGNGLSQLREPQTQQASVLLRWMNEAPALGLAMPAGTVRVYGEAEEGRQLLLLGESRIGHTASGEEIELRLGSAFDIVAERTQTAYRKIAERASETAWQIELRNAGAEDVSVVVEERLGGDWRLQESSLEPVRRDAQRLEWTVEVPAGGAATVSYRVESRY